MTQPPPPQWPGAAPDQPAYPPTHSPVPPPGYRAFGYPSPAETPEAPAGSYPPPPLPPPPTSWAPVPPPRNRSGRRAAGIVGAIVVIGLIRFGASTVFDSAQGALRDPLHTPAKIGSAPLLVSQFAREVEADMKSEMDASQKPQAGVYGRNGRPQYALLAGYGFEENGNQVLAGFMEESEGLTFGKPKAMTNGMSCVTVVEDGVKGAVCAWGGGKSDGLLWSFTKPDINALAKLTAQARTDVENPPV